MLTRRILRVVVFALLFGSAAFAQPANLRGRAKQPYDEGLEHMRREAFDAAAKSFEAAVMIDDTFDMAYYMLGRAHLARKQYAVAVYALEKCRHLHQTDAMRGFTDKQEGQRLRRERLAELDQLIADTQSAASLPQNATMRFRLIEQVRQFQERKRQIQDLDRSEDLSPSRQVPGFVSLSLGSAHFRSGNMAEAEKAYRATIAADPRIGEAHNNLAVVFFETGRYAEADQAVRAAERVGVKVHPQLKADIAAKIKTP